MTTDLNLLVVDDSPSVRKVFEVLLRDVPCVLATVGSATEALEYLESHSVDALVCDLVLPDRSGEEVCEIFRKNSGAERGILVVSGLVDTEVRAWATALGNTRVLRKPFDPIEALGILREFLELDSPMAEVSSPRDPVAAIMGEVRGDGVQLALMVRNDGPVLYSSALHPPSSLGELVLHSLAVRERADELAVLHRAVAADSVFVETSETSVLVYAINGAHSLVLLLDSAATLGKARLMAKRAAGMLQRHLPLRSS